MRQMAEIPYLLLSPVLEGEAQQEPLLMQVNLEDQAVGEVLPVVSVAQVIRPQLLLLKEITVGMPRLLNGVAVEAVPVPLDLRVLGVQVAGQEYPIRLPGFQ